MRALVTVAVLVSALGAQRAMTSEVTIPVNDQLERAEWIWCDGEPIPKNFYLYCRRSFEVRDDVDRAVLQVSADSRYQLFLNGRFVGRGPARCLQEWQEYDTYDLRPLLRPGENCIAAVVHQFGVETHSYTLGRGGFIAQGDVEAGGVTTVLDTGAGWRVLPAPPWRRDVPRATFAIMWQEHYDARKEPVGWKSPGFDDSEWQDPIILGRPPVMPWKNLVPRDIPHLREEELRPVTIVDQGTVHGAPLAARIDTKTHFGPTPALVGYVFAFAHSEEEQEVVLSLRGTQGMAPWMLWVNGRNRSPDLAPGDAGRMAAQFQLEAGWNEVLLKFMRPRPDWTFDISLQAPRPGYVTWHAKPDAAAPRGEAWLAGPYAVNEHPSPEAVMKSYEVQQIVLSRKPGTPVTVPGKVIPLSFGPGSNVAFTMGMEDQVSGATPIIRNPDALTQTGAGAVVVTTPEGEGAYITLDYGQNLSAYLKLKLNGVAGGVVDMGFAETLANGRLDPLRAGLSYADRYVMRDGPQEWQLYFYKGFRYVQLTFRDCPEPVEVELANAVFTSYPVEYGGEFTCSDPLLNRIWDVGRWTLQLCMHDGYEDTPWREQGQWLGDAQVEFLANYVCFGDTALAEKALRQFAQGQYENGGIPAMCPATQGPLPHGIPTFMAQWVSILLDHYRWTGNRDIVEELYPNLVRLMAFFETMRNNQGLLEDVPGFVFLDWMPVNDLMPEFGHVTKQGIFTGMNAHYYRALRDAAAMADLMGDTTRQEKWAAAASTLHDAINGLLWDEDRGVYGHGIGPEGPIDRLAVHDTVLASYAELAAPERNTLAFDALYGEDRLDAVQVGSPYFYHFFLEGMRKAGLDEMALEMTRRDYGPMIEAGATSLWEQFHGRESLSHAWSCGPNYDLSTHVLGVRPAAPGFEAVTIAPRPSGLAWANGVVPTVRGDITTKWTCKEDRFLLEFGVPFEATVEARVPDAYDDSVRAWREETPLPQALTPDGCVRLEAPGKFRVVGMGPRDAVTESRM